MSRFIKLNRTSHQGFLSVLVNLDKVTFIAPQSGKPGCILWFGKTSVDVVENFEQVQAKLIPPDIPRE